MSDNVLLEIKNLNVIYDTDEGTIFAVNGVDLSVMKGESLGLVGETGAGKTTTALAILRLVADPPGIVKEGQILFEGKDLLKVSKADMRDIRGEEISMIFQDPMTSLNPIMTVGDQIAEVVQLHGDVSKAESRERAREILELVGIPRSRYGEYPHQFSGGMKQRVVIAMSIVCSPRLILADEPTTALDVTIQAQVLELMNELKQTMATSLLLITHDLGVVAQVCDRVAIMYAGEIVEIGPKVNVFDFPHHPYTIGLFESIPTLDTTTSKLKPIEGQMPDPCDLPSGCFFHPRCPYAQPLCDSEKPDLVDIGEGHSVRCLLQEGKIESVSLEEVIRRGR